MYYSTSHFYRRQLVKVQHSKGRLTPYNQTVVGWISATVFGILVYQNRVESNEDAKRLYKNLMSNYNKLIRPVSNSSESLTVKLGLKLSQLIGVVCSNCSICLINLD